MSKNKGKKWDGKSRVSNDLYLKRYDEIFKRTKEKIMTFEFGIGMFFYNMVCLLIGLLILYYVINNLK